MRPGFFRDPADVEHVSGDADSPFDFQTDELCGMSIDNHTFER